MDTINSKDPQMTNKNNALLFEITNNNNDNSNQISSNQRNEAKKEYDIWKDIGLYTYILFFVNIIYIITLIIYFYYTFDKKAFEKCTFFLVFSGIFELIYIIYSFLIFFCKSKIEILVYYVYLVFFASIFTFISSLVDFTDDGDEYDWHYKFTTTCKVIVISGSSIISLLSLIYVVLACKLLYCNKYVKIIYIN
jgi:hypothetical protein